MNNKLANFAPLLFLAFASRAAVPYGAAPQQTGDLLLPSGEITAATPASQSTTSTTASRLEPPGR